MDARGRKKVCPEHAQGLAYYYYYYLMYYELLSILLLLLLLLISINIITSINALLPSVSGRQPETWLYAQMYVCTYVYIYIYTYIYI